MRREPANRAAALFRPLASAAGAERGKEAQSATTDYSTGSLTARNAAPGPQEGFYRHESNWRHAHFSLGYHRVTLLRKRVVVVLHDGDLMRMAGDPRKISALTMQDLETIDIGRKYGPAFVGEHVPTLAAVIATVRGRMKLNVELKYNAPYRRLRGRLPNAWMLAASQPKFP